jgi:hypothetical protein
MDVRLILFKVKQRLNKLDSSDYDNLECHQIVEAYNKAQIDWARRQLHGNNLYKEGAENTVTRVDDLQILLTPIELLGSNRDYYFLSRIIPENYLRYNNLRVFGSKGECKNQRLKSYLREEANSEELLRDASNKPSFMWRETFHTFIGDKIKVYTDGDFSVAKVELVYYRTPREIRIVGCDYLGQSSSENVDPELKDDVVELIIDDAVALLASDIENVNQIQAAIQRSEKSN